MFVIPGTTMQVRFFDRVEAVDGQYDIVDLGIQHEDGGIDSVVFGGSFHSLKKAMGKADQDAAKARKKAAKKLAKKQAKAEAKAAAKKAEKKARKAAAKAERKMTPVVEKSSNGVAPVEAEVVAA